MADVFSDPLVISLLIASITVVSNGILLYKLRRWEYNAEYVIANVKGTYIPLLSEIQDKIKTLDDFPNAPNSLRCDFTELERIKKSGLFEFIESHDKKLSSQLLLFYNQIYPRFVQLSTISLQTRQSIRQNWTDYIQQFCSDAREKDQVSIIVNWMLDHGVYSDLLNNRKPAFEDAWEGARCFMASNPKNCIRLDFGRPDQFAELAKLSETPIQSLLDYYRQTIRMIDEEARNSLIPSMQKYIRKPI